MKWKRMQNIIMGTAYKSNENGNEVIFHIHSISHFHFSLYKPSETIQKAFGSSSE